MTTVLKLRDDDRPFREQVARDLRSYWLRAYLGLYLTPEERARFRRLETEDLVELILHIKRMKRRGFDPVLAREVRRSVLAPGEPDTPVTARAAVGALFGPPARPPATPSPSAEGTTPVRQASTRGRQRGRYADDPGQRLLPFMTPSLLVPE